MVPTRPWRRVRPARYGLEALGLEAISATWGRGAGLGRATGPPIAARGSRSHHCGSPCSWVLRTERPRAKRKQPDFWSFGIGLCGTIPASNGLSLSISAHRYTTAVAVQLRSVPPLVLPAVSLIASCLAGAPGGAPPKPTLEDVMVSSLQMQARARCRPRTLYTCGPPEDTAAARLRTRSEPHAHAATCYASPGTCGWDHTHASTLGEHSWGRRPPIPRYRHTARNDWVALKRPRHRNARFRWEDRRNGPLIVQSQQHTEQSSCDRRRS